ncbi:hypothetical protein SSPS47_11385 [Streptomyces sp. S4.7]|uniref:hypothetical protein n=1 Tax=unclassified Streptomyces TaxID=2593676 RepID=UPI0011C8BCEE|nr:MULTISPECIES: hypothetical protein [unclassified Streptomyces]QHY95721.1 hypothetical protein SSPS47_11385 [Streptomyces sp. S4.7]TXL88817.1 hypothetical protein EW053_16965 [Streptomyces sp. IB2014 016-6]
MRNLSRTARAETLLSKRTKADIARALARRDDFKRQGLMVMAQGALEVRISVVVKMSVASFLEYAATEAHGRYMAHLEVCGCRAVGAACKAGDALLSEWRDARELAGVDA